MRNEGKVQAVERMKAHARPLPDGYPFDRDQANARRVAIAAAKNKRAAGLNATRSQYFRHNEDGLLG